MVEKYVSKVELHILICDRTIASMSVVTIKVLGGGK